MISQTSKTLPQNTNSHSKREFYPKSTPLKKKSNIDKLYTSLWASKHEKLMKKIKSLEGGGKSDLREKENFFFQNLAADRRSSELYQSQKFVWEIEETKFGKRFSQINPTTVQTNQYKRFKSEKGIDRIWEKISDSLDSSNSFLELSDSWRVSEGELQSSEQNIFEEILDKKCAQKDYNQKFTKTEDRGQPAKVSSLKSTIKDVNLLFVENLENEFRKEFSKTSNSGLRLARIYLEGKRVPK
jgi:hypothetical protein